ncbi:hypothetical protein EV715DRAFT_295935 [Schizophyllum commune]
MSLALVRCALAAPAKQHENAGEDLPSMFRFWAADEKRSVDLPSENPAEISKRTDDCGADLRKAWAVEDKRGEGVADCSIPKA